MNPEQLAKSGTEHAEQMALFCWANKALTIGFDAANDIRSYSDPKLYDNWPYNKPIECLKWLHAIPNAGARGNKVAAAQLKAEGVKAGVADIFLPVGRWHGEANPSKTYYAGLYIELKRAKGVPSDVSDEQIEFAKFVTSQGFAWCPAFGYKEATHLLEAFLTCVTPTLTKKQAQVLALVAAK